MSTDQTPNSMSPRLTAEDKAFYRAWARQSYEPNGAINESWHPVVRQECERIDREAAIRREAVNRKE